jgi:hypothetical protein
MSHLQSDPARCGERINSGLAAKATVTGVADSTEWRLVLVVHGLVIHMDEPRP